MKNLIKAICEAEGKKHQASVGDVREILSILTDIIATPEDNNPLGIEFVKAIHSKVFKKYRARVGVNINLAWSERGLRTARIIEREKKLVKKSDILFKKRKPKKK